MVEPREANYDSEVKEHETNNSQPRARDVCCYGLSDLIIRTRTYWVTLSLLALLTSTPLVLLTSFLGNDTLAVFATHEYRDGGFDQIRGYGFPFAFAEQVSAIDTIRTSFHWWMLSADICLVTTALVLLGHMMARLGVLDLSPP